MNQDAQLSALIYKDLELQSTEQQIRLLEVSETLLNGQISCHLSRHSLHDARYVVLSYQWGSSDATHQILLNGHPFLVRGNLYGFLSVIREQRDMLLWIDALCINQTDIEERNQQVKIMGSIFRGAAMVLSWLGPSNPAIAKSFDLMTHVWSLTDVDPEIATENERLPGVFDEATNDELWRCVVEVCSLPYWNRVWVVQEVLLSWNNYLLCGNKTLTWQVFANFMSLVDVRFHCPPQHRQIIHGSTAKSYAMSKPYVMVPQRIQWTIGNDLIHDYGKAWDKKEYNLFRILTMFGDRDCTDPLDHIYALLSLTTEGINFPIRYGIDRIQLLLYTFHFCGLSAALRPGATPSEDYRPVSQRALIRNARFLAEILEIVPKYQKPTPYLYGASTNARGPNPRTNPCFPCHDQHLILQCSAVQPGNEPPILRSNTLRRSLSAIAFDTILHIDESTSWLLCRDWQGREAALTIVALVTMKDSPNGRGFRILVPCALNESVISLADTSNGPGRWEMTVPPEAHLEFLKFVILGMQ